MQRGAVDGSRSGFTSNTQARDIYAADNKQILPRATQEDFWAAVEDADTAFGGKESLESPSHDTIPHAFKFEKTIPFKADQEDEIIIVVAKGFYYRGLGKLRDLPLKRKVTVKVEEASSDIFPGFTCRMIPDIHREIALIVF
ncbi:hypothetical protein H0H93_001404 [Arthromyces matolae]|nr:hypothetical protein H0H93_001404 [Arthromyces matolae]